MEKRCHRWWCCATECASKFPLSKYQAAIALPLFSIHFLLASGFTQSRFAPGARTAQIGDLDIAVDGITSAQYGFAFIKNREDVRRDYSLFPLDKSANYLDEASTPDLVIVCGDIDPEKLALWMSYGQTFIHIPHPEGGRAKIGQIVIPGKTPCLRCAELVERDQSGVISQRVLSAEVTQEYPHIAAHAVAALAASNVVAYCDAATLSEGEVLKDAESLWKNHYRGLSKSCPTTGGGDYSPSTLRMCFLIFNQEFKSHSRLNEQLQSPDVVVDRRDAYVR